MITYQSLVSSAKSDPTHHTVVTQPQLTNHIKRCLVISLVTFIIWMRTCSCHDSVFLPLSLFTWVWPHVILPWTETRIKKLKNLGEHQRHRRNIKPAWQKVVSVNKQHLTVNVIQLLNPRRDKSRGQEVVLEFPLTTCCLKILWRPKSRAHSS